MRMGVREGGRSKKLREGFKRVTDPGSLDLNSGVATLTLDRLESRNSPNGDTSDRPAKPRAWRGSSRRAAWTA